MITIGSDTARSPIRKLDRDIRSVEDWFRLAPPKRSSPWKDGRSAKELAHYWLKETGGNRFPPVVEALLLQSHDFSSVLRWSAEPEAQSRFDDFGGEPRNCDLLVDAEDRRGKYIIAIEAKADESFDRYLPDILANALERRLRNPSSRGIERILQLTSHILGEGPKGAPQVNQIRYQLLTATAGFLPRQDGNSRTAQSSVSRNSSQMPRRMRCTERIRRTFRISYGVCRAARAAPLAPTASSGPSLWPELSQEFSSTWQNR